MIEGSVRYKSSLGLPDKTLTTKEKILGNKPIGYREGDGLTDKSYGNLT